MGHCDIVERLPRPGPVNLGSLVLVPGNRFQSREHIYHNHGRSEPYINQHQAYKGQRTAGQKLRRRLTDTQLHQDVWQEAVYSVENPLPGKCDDNGWKCPGDDEKGLINALAHLNPLQGQGSGKSHPYLSHQGQDRPFQRVEK